MQKWPDLEKRRKILRLKNFDYSNPNYVYFLTVSARVSETPFIIKDLAEEVVSSLLFLRNNKRVSLYCYCLMPDHLHLALSPANSSGDVSKIIQDFKSYTTRIGWKYGISGKLWQRNFYDHIARKDEDLLKICEYILANPIRKGLVENRQEWKYSGIPDPLPV